MNLHDLFLYIFFYFLSSGENERYEDDVLQLMPAADELSVQLLREKLIKAASIPYSSNTDSIHIWVNDKRRTHEGHHLQLINSNELKNHHIDDDILLLCDVCVQPIRTHHFYGCTICKYFLHKFCAEFPKQIKHHLVSGTTVSLVLPLISLPFCVI